MTGLHRNDGLVLAIYLLGVLVLGWWFSKGTRGLHDYFLGDGDLPWWAILGSIVATETSAATFLSVPGLAFGEHGNLTFLQLSIGYVLGRLVVAFWLVPLYFRGEVFSAYELLQTRLGGATKTTAALIFLVTRNLGDALRLALTAIVLEKLTGWPLAISVVVSGASTTIYTLLGGIKAVVWNDCLQMVVYWLGALAAGGVLLAKLDGGLAAWIAYGQHHGNFQVLDLSLHWDRPFTLWAGIIGGLFMSMGTHGTDQMMVQRYRCARTLQDGQRALILSGLVVACQFLTFLLLGVGLSAFYTQSPPAVAFPSNDHVFPTFLIQEIPAGWGIIGLVLAAVFAAAMSTISSSIHASAGSLINDLLPYLLPTARTMAPPIFRETYEWQASVRRPGPWAPQSPTRDQGASQVAPSLATGRLLTLAFGGLQTVLALGALTLSNSVIHEAMTIAGFSSGLLLGLFALGTLHPHVNQRAALVGLMGGACILLSLHVSKSFGWTQVSLAWPWYPLVGTATSIALGSLAATRPWGKNLALDTSQGDAKQIE